MIQPYALLMLNQILIKPKDNKIFLILTLKHFNLQVQVKKKKIKFYFQTFKYFYKNQFLFGNLKFEILLD